MACFLCMSSEDTNKCEICEKVFSCSRHGKTHINSKGICYPYKVEADAQKGRYLVAVRSIAPGEVISSEVAAVVGPCTRSKPQCLQCFKLISTSARFNCFGCGFPLCSEECAEGSFHLGECQMFRSCGFKANIQDLSVFDKQYSAITVLRLLRCIEQESGDESKHEHATSLVSTLEDHDEDRRSEQPETWHFQRQLVVDFIQKKCGLESKYSEDQIRKATGILMTNGTSLQLPGRGFGVGIGLFPVYAMGNHSCISNTKTIVTHDLKLEIIAQTKISAGEEITNPYMSTDKPTYIRRPYLREKWFFDCTCSRCSDPTELGSHMSSLLCTRSKCRGSAVPSHPLDYQSDWVCLSCGAVTCLDRVQSVLESAAQLMATRVEEEDVVQHYERVLHKLSSQLHPYNHLMIDVKQKLALLYGNIDKYSMVTMGRPAKQRKVQLCMEVMDCQAKITVGVSARQARVLNEMLITKEVIAKEDFQTGLIDKKSLKNILLKSKLQLLQLAFQQSKLTQNLQM